jgi:hypothetical protein
LLDRRGPRNTPSFICSAHAGFAGAGLSYSLASGTVWNGAVSGLSWRGNDLGGAKIALHPLAMLRGRLGADVTLDGSGVVTGGGYAAMTPWGLIVDDLSLSAEIASLPLLLPMSGKISVEIAHADVRAGGCSQIEGAARTDALMNRPAGLAWQGPELAGPIECRGGAIVVPLKGGAESQAIAVAMTLGADGTFGIRIEARAPDSAVASVLSAIGFVETDGVMTLTQHGRWS